MVSTISPSWAQSRLFEMRRPNDTRLSPIELQDNSNNGEFLDDSHDELDTPKEEINAHLDAITDQM